MKLKWIENKQGVLEARSGQRLYQVFPPYDNYAAGLCCGRRANLCLADTAVAMALAQQWEDDALAASR
jgi:hypothetical protein